MGKARVPVRPQPLSSSPCPAGSRDTAHLSPSDLASLAYQRVQKVDCTSLRPVLVLGPLLDVVKEMLVNEAPGKFCRCPLGKGPAPGHSVSVSVSAVSWGRIPWCFTAHRTWVSSALASSGLSGREDNRAGFLTALLRSVLPQNGPQWLTVPGLSSLCLCFAEVMKASQQAIERGVKDCLFVDYKRRSGHFDVTTVASIKEITEKVRIASDLVGAGRGLGLGPGAFGPVSCASPSSPVSSAVREPAWG